jgi:amidase
VVTWREAAVDPITSMDATALAASIRDGVLTSAGVVQACLDRIGEVNGKLGAVTVTFAEQARREAVEADARQASGAELGPLHGIPVTVKELYDVAGSPTTLGVAAFAGAIAPQDAPSVSALRRAGAIVLGRTNMPDFATRWHTDNDLRGPTINPWDRGRSPGGSSGGDAVAVAAGMVPIGLGGDYGGSLRVPANACGVAALRPTPGRVPRASSLPGPSPSMTIQLFAADGPLARSVRDLSLAFDVLRARDDRDPNWIPAAESSDQRPSAVAVTADPCGEGVDPEVRDALRRSADALAEAGYPVAEAEPPCIGEARDAFRDLVATEISVLTLDLVRQLASPGLLAFLDAYLQNATVLDHAGYARALADRLALCTAWSRFLEDHPIVLGPVSTELPWPAGFDLGGPDHVRRMFSAYRLTVAVNLLGLPAVAIPTGLSRQGLPLGAQIITRRFAERRALDAAGTIEARLGTLAPIDPKEGP